MIAAMTGLIAMLCLLFAVPDRRLAIDPANSLVTATVSFFGFAKKTAHFPKVEGFADMVGDDVRLDVRVDAAALVAPDSVTERRLKGEDFFDVARHPIVRFVGSGLHATGSAAGAIDGSVIVRGVSRPARLDVRFSRPLQTLAAGGAFHVSAVTEIDRRDFGMTAYPLIVGRRVRIAIEADLQPYG